MDDDIINLNNFPELKTNTFTDSKNTTTVLSSTVLGDVLVQSSLDPNCTSAVIFLHGCGDTGPVFHLWIMYVLGEFITFPHAKVLFPTAPDPDPLPEPKSSSSDFSDSDLDSRIPHQTQWFNEFARKAFDREDFRTSHSSGMLLYDFINEELIKKGIPQNRIVVGGFGQGGTMALHVAYRFLTKIAGVFTLSSYLSYDSEVYGALEQKQKIVNLYKLPPNMAYLPPLFFCYGAKDEIASIDEADVAYETMVELGVKGERHVWPNLTHLLEKDELLLLVDWIKKRLA